MTALRSSGDIGPILDAGGSTNARWTTSGRPFSSRNEISASPTPSSVMTFSVSSAGLARIVDAADLTAF